jgi:aminoglycoside 3-N-acetyltransferase
MDPALPLVVKSRLVRDLAALGVAPGGVLMLHASVRAVGWVVGGPDVVLDALLEVLGPAGTLMMYVGWEEDMEDFTLWPPQRRAAYLAECPPFEPATSRAHRRWSILTEYLRTRPGARRSANPCASIAAVGARAAWITADHPLQYGYGPGSPLAKLVGAGGQVLLLGSPLDAVTLLHYSEHVAAVPDKRLARYRVPLRREGELVWVDVEEFDTGSGIVDREGGDYFAVIVGQFLAAGHGRTGTVGAATSYLLDAAALHRFAVDWMERTLAPPSGRVRE